MREPAKTPAEDPVAQVRARGWALAPGYVSPDDLRQLRQNARMLVSTPGALADSQYFFDRQADGSARLARVERIAEAVLPAPLRERMKRDTDRCLNGDSALFKDKLNIRYPQSRGYAPHQDAARWDAFGTGFLSFGVFLSASSPENGGFEFATGPKTRGRINGPGEDLQEDIFARMARAPVLARPGDVLMIDGDAPHRTTDNCSGETVLHMLFTFGTGLVADAREGYYSHQRRIFDTVRTGNLFVFEPR